MTKESLTAAIAAAQRGDDEAFGKLYEYYRPLIVRHLQTEAKGVPDVDIEALTQDTFIKSWQAIGRTRPGLRMEFWLKRIATNTLRSSFRRRKIVRWQPLVTMQPAGTGPDARPDTRFVFLDRLTPEHHGSADEPMLRAERVQLVRARLREMPPKYRHALVTYMYQEPSIRELGALLGITDAATKSLLQRARESFRNLWLDAGYE